MNMLSNIAVQQLDEAGMLSPVNRLRANVTQDDINAGVQRAHVLRAQAVQRALSRLGASIVSLAR